MLKVVHSGSF